MKFGIIRERKNPPDRRVVLSPEACEVLLKKFPKASIAVERSPIRVFLEDAYEKARCSITDDVSDCDVLLGVKEVPMEALIPNKKYFFFSHTIKKQPYNRGLLQTILEKNIELYDHEVITKENGQRLVAFGRYAGIVGAYNGFRTVGLKYRAFDLPKAESLPNQKGLISELNHIKSKLPQNLKILLTGKGRVGNGAKEMLDAMELKKVTVNEYLHHTFEEPVYCQIDVLEYNKRKDGQHLGRTDFYQHPEAYESNFMRFAKVTDFYIAGHFFGDGAPYLFTREDAKNEKFKIKVVADVSCDIDGPVACTIKPSTIADPIYGYDPETESETDFMDEKAIAVMAVDNLPCELPADASEGFGEMFVKYVIPAFFNNDKNGVLERARMTQNGKLTERYAYLQDFVDGKE
ncbi:Alanine dehydrogenase [Pustulibacterium marinum]|uniref:Alanine dehydrogenase n=1 Tax=Pustulibacterium marinum TaxID=1224947 RepID=A0A1I7HU88_9FLAO|nr:NAD(P)-dependent oxidoreductase [Pustulibacterium marinum]SFU64308.1 Alanine dehydrogenase [Pustulibacterium marinum]